MPTLQDLINDVPDCPSAGCFGDGGIVHVVGDNLMDKPLRVQQSRIMLQGNGRFRCSTVRQGNFYGPLAVFAPDYAGPPTDDPLVDGSNGSLKMEGGNDWYYNLRDAQNVELNGLSAFTVEFHYKPEIDTLETPDTRDIISSQGRRLTSEGLDIAFNIQHHVNNLIQAWFTIGGTQHHFYSIDDGLHGMMPGNVYHVALSYDGSRVRLFIDGIVMNNLSCSGTLIQQPHEDVSLGSSTLDWPALTRGGNATTGCVDNVRISSVCRYDAAFTPPTAKYADDGSTIMLLTFGSERFDGIMLEGEAAGHVAWLPLHRKQNAQLVHVGIRDLNLIGQGPYFFNVNRLYMESVFCDSLMVGPYLEGQAYLNKFDQVMVLAGGGAHARAGLTSVLGGNNNITNCDFGGSAYPLVLAGGSARIAGLNLAPNDYTRISALLRGLTGNTTFTISDLKNDDESSNPLCEGVVALDDIQHALLLGGSIDNAASSASPLFIVDGGGSISLSMLLNNAAGGPIFKVRGAPARNIEARNCQVTAATGPWAATSGELAHIDHN